MKHTRMKHTRMKHTRMKHTRMKHTRMKRPVLTRVYVDFIARSIATAEEHPEITAARKALEAVNKAIAAYEAEKSVLTEAAAKPGVKGLTAKHSLAQIESGPLMETLNRALITAEAKVRIATKKHGGGAASLNRAIRSLSANGAAEPAPVQCGSNEGTLWWMNRDLEEKKKRYGKR